LAVRKTFAHQVNDKLLMGMTELFTEHSVGVLKNTLTSSCKNSIQPISLAVGNLEPA